MFAQLVFGGFGCLVWGLAKDAEMAGPRQGRPQAGARGIQVQQLADG